MDLTRSEDRCITSPSGAFQFCRPGYQRGSLGCSESVDAWTGRTSCSNTWDCYAGGNSITDGDDELGDEEKNYYAANTPYTWTDVETIRLV